MSGWLHPEGPETESTYWSRRFVVIAAAVVLIALAFSLIGGAASGSEPSAASSPVVVPPAATLSSPPSSPAAGTPSGSSTSTSSTSSTAGPAQAGDASSSALGATPSASASTSAAGSSTAPKSARPAAGPTAAKAQAASDACASRQLRTTLQGDPNPKVKQKVTFALSVINGSDRTCTLTLTSSTVLLTIHSGTDRIWSTDDCHTLVRPVKAKVGSQRAVAWKITWNGLRSESGCRTRPEVPRPGTYVATFQLNGANAVTQRMMVTAS